MTINQQADIYASTHSDVRQAFLDGYRAARVKKKDLDLSFVPEEFGEVVDKWLAYKNERKSGYTQSGVKSMFKKLFALSYGNPEIADAIVEQSIANNWQGLFALKDGYASESSIARARLISAQNARESFIDKITPARERTLEEIIS